VQYKFLELLGPATSYSGNVELCVQAPWTTQQRNSFEINTQKHSKHSNVRCTLVQSAVLPILSVRLSVCNVRALRLTSINGLQD